jgi:hypothetical protein
MSTQPDGPTEGRVYFRDVKPSGVVDALDQLPGPAHGAVEPVSLRVVGFGRRPVTVGSSTI